MDLHGIVSGAISAVNPPTTMTIQVSTGSTTSPDGSRVPAYADSFVVEGEVQPMGFRDLAQVEGLNLNGTKRAIYLHGKFDGVVRSALKGGDVITIKSGVNAGTWLVALVLEQFPDWCKVAVTLQNGG